MALMKREERQRQHITAEESRTKIKLEEQIEREEGST